MATEGDGKQESGKWAGSMPERSGLETGKVGDGVPEMLANEPTPSPDAVPPARAHATPELAHRLSDLLAEPHATLMGACAKARVQYRSVKRWLATDDVEPGSDLEAFQHLVTEALERERVAELERLEDEFAALGGPTVAKAGPLVNKFTWNHQNRFRRFYAEDEDAKAVKLEHTGAGGGAIKTANVNVSGRGLSDATRRQIVEGILGVPRAMLEAGAKMGELDMSSGGDEGDGEE